MRWLERSAWMLAGVLLGGGLTATASSSSVDTVYRKLEVLAEVISYVEAHYVDAVSPTDLVYGAARGAVSTLDEHSTFFSPDEYDSLMDSTEGEYAGIGIEVDVQDGALEIVSVLDGSPAKKAALVAGDRIIAIDGQPTGEVDFEWAHRALRGPVGSKVVLTVQRAGREQPWQFTVVRSWIRISPLEQKPLTGGISYVRVKTFSRRIAADLGSMLERTKPLTGIVLDLRNNPGGLFDEAIETCDLFLDGGPIVSAMGRGGRLIEQREARPGGVAVTQPIAILIDRSSASASEIVAGCLHDRGRGRLFGTRSYGKGSVQSILDLSDGSGLKLTIARYVTPSGRPIDGHGIEPDEPVEAGDGDRDAALLAAQTWVQKQIR
jgi:carboxyl-terminal processing protease